MPFSGTKRLKAALAAGAVHSGSTYGRSAWIMRDGRKRIPRNNPGSVRNTACTDRAGEGTRDLTSNMDSASASVPASRKCERAWNRECNCQCDGGEFHGCLLFFLDRRQPRLYD